MRLVYRAGGIDLPEHPLGSLRDIARRMQAGAASEEWVQVRQGRFPDIILFRTSSRLVGHVGVVWSRTHFLHSSKFRGGPALERFGASPFTAQIKGVYRWHSLIGS